MNEFKANCDELKRKFIKLFPSITQDDLDCSNGRKSEMCATLENKSGKSIAEIRSIISSL